MKLDEIDKISNSIRIILQTAEKKRDTLLKTPMAAYLHSKQEGFKKPVIAVTFILLAGIYVLFSPLGLGG